MMFGDDTCSTISSTMLSEFGGDDDGGEDEEVSSELKYVPPPPSPPPAQPVDNQRQQFGRDFNLREVVIKIEKMKEVPMSPPPPPSKKPVRKKFRAGLRDHLSLKEKRALDMKQRRANMTPEQKEMAKERERLRKQRARALERTRREEMEGLEDLVAEEDGGRKRRQRRSVVKVEVEVDVKNEVDGGDGEETVKRRRSGGRRKKRSEMSEEELEATRAKWREEMRLKRALQREQMTEEEREQLLERQREQRRKSREKMRMTMTEEQRREEAQREAIKRIEKLAGMTEEERRAERMGKYLRDMARKAGMSKEELEERRRRRQEWHRRRREGMTEEDLERRRQRVKRYRDNMAPERKQRFLEKLREGYRKRKERMKREDPGRVWRVRRGKGEVEVVEVNKVRRRRRGRYEEETEEERERRLMHKRLNGAKWGLRCRLKKKGVPPGEIEEKVKELENNYEFKRRVYGREGETEEEKRERIRKQRNLSQRRIKLRKKMEVHKLIEGGMSIEEAKEQIEGSETRERYLIRQRIKWAKANLRKRLQSAGASPSEIELRVKELEATYQPTYSFRPYKPRPDTWKPIDPNDLALLSDISPKIPNTTITDLKPIIASTSTSITSPLKSKKAISSPKKSTSTPSHAPRHPGPGRPPKIHQETSLRPHSSQYPPPLTPAPYYTQQVPSSTHHHFYQQTPAHQNHFQVHYHHPPGGGYPQQPDYSNSYSDTHSPPPASPDDDEGGGDDDDYSSSFGGDYSTQNTFNPSQHPPLPTNYSSTPSTSLKKDGTPRKTRKGIPNPKKARFGPRGQFKKTKKPPNQDNPGLVTCDLCENAYPATYITKHRNMHHNPNYQNQLCLLCGDKFTVARVWWLHYKKEHGGGGNPPLKKSTPSEDRTHMCDDCGASFKRNNILEAHKYKMHGDGLKLENYERCPICKEDKLFKSKISLDVHLRNKHEEYWRERMTVECFRCEERFAGEVGLGKHVKECHEESYFPCGYCEGVRFSRIGREFHWFRCKKVSKERREEMRGVEGITSLDAERLPCEFCGRRVRVSGMTRHYGEVHGVRDGDFTCVWCGRGFRVREFWAVHMEEMHGREVEEVREMVRKFSKVEREGLEVRNREGTWGGAVEGGVKMKRGERKGSGMGGGKRKMSRGGGNKRNIVVIAEEDGGNREVMGRRGSVKKKEEVDEEKESEEDEDEEEEGDEWRGSGED